MDNPTKKKADVKQLSQQPHEQAYQKSKKLKLNQLKNLQPKYRH